MRLITRGDMDGLCCAVLLTTRENIDEIVFAHPKDMQDGLVEVRPGDIIANLPYHPMCDMWFDHHESEQETANVAEYRGLFGLAPSAARLVYQYYDDRELDRFGELLAETDRIDSARLAIEDISDPQGWVLISYTLDPRSGLGAFRQYFLRLVEAGRVNRVAEILAMPDVQEKVARFMSEQERYADVTRELSRVDENVIITDFRELDSQPVGNRFLVYTLFPSANISVRLFWGRGRDNIVAAVGKSIFNRSCKTHVGNMLAEYGGGGLQGAGTAQFAPDVAEAKTAEIVARLKADDKA
jgi:nanoRNase/pAp phosphatase (c-di-AMP/oligoRNAs hydrolase)